MKVTPSLLPAVALGLLVTNLFLVSRATGTEGAPMASQATFQIVHEHKSVPILFDQKDAEVVGVSAKALAKDIEQITGTLPALETSLKPDRNALILIGTIGSSEPIDHLMKTGKISKERIEGKWESFLIQVVDNPFPGVEKSLVIAGSDPRGTAFGVFEISKRLGVSPWVWWADVKPAHQDELLVVLDDDVVMGPPSVKFRGIFLNDEDWGLHPWAKKNMDMDIEDIGPNTYAQIFELMLRLKANYIWPAMHPCTKAFFYYPENADVAKRYSMVLGSSHCEPMLRNNVDEWSNNFEGEYHKKPGPWRYDTNRDEIERYWEDRVIQSTEVDAIYTVGMRGIHDGSMPGPTTLEGKVELLSQVIADQRSLLSKHLSKKASEIAQIFCPYKEALELYKSGTKVPEDVTIVWADDNHGYIRKLSNPEEQKRSGRSGVYYHISYWGPPEDYLWLSSTAPSLISYELSKAYAYGADRLWVINVGDIKPAELETEFAMDLAWDVNAWSPERAHEYVAQWAARTFGNAFSKEIAEIKAVYYRLAAAGKPEHMNRVPFSIEEMENRLATYQEIAHKAEALKERMPARLQDAYFQLILYPVLAASKMNEKILYARMGRGDKALHAYEEIVALTETYNKEIADGKWDGMMSMHPRDREVFNKPTVLDSEAAKTSALPEPPLKTVSVTELQFDPQELHLVPGLGVSGVSLTRKEFDGPSYQEADISNAPTASGRVELPKGLYQIKLLCVPTHAIHEGRGLRMAITINGGDRQLVDVNTPSRTDTWGENVIRGYSSAETLFDLKEDGSITIQIALLDPGLALSEIAIYRQQNP